MTQYSFNGNLICPEELSEASPVFVFHRQLDPVKPCGKLPQNVHMLFRKKFSANSKAKTIIKITADDYYKLYINGKYVGQGPAAGFHFHYYFNEFDISDYINDGENTIAIHAYYQGLINRVWVSGDDRAGVIFDIISDGEVIAKSDETVSCCIHDGFEQMGMVGYETQFMERYDSNSKCVMFEQSDYDDSTWKKARIYKNSDHKFYPQKTKNLVTEEILPAEIKKNGNLSNFKDWNRF